MFIKGKRGIFLLILALLSISCKTNSTRLDDNHIKFNLDKFGEFIHSKQENSKRENDETIVTGGILTYGEVLEIRKNTDKVKIDIGSDFGIEFSVTGIENPQTTNVVVKIKHPSIVNRECKRESTEDSFEMALHGHTGNQIGWLIEREWEVVKGKWIFQIYYEGNMVIEKTIITY